MAYVRGLVSDEERKNPWTLSKRAGHGTPDGMQRLLGHGLGSRYVAG